MKMGILGAGGIAGTMAATIAQMDTVESWAVAARDLSRAQAFAEKYGFQKAYGSYEEMLEDPELELVYIATLHPLHYEHVKLCLEHGKHVRTSSPSPRATPVRPSGRETAARRCSPCSGS